MEGEAITARLTMEKLSVLFRRAQEIHGTDGAAALFRRGLAFILSSFFEYRAYWLYEYALENLRDVNEADFAPRVNHAKLKIVGANDEADRLEAEGFEFRSQIPNATTMLESGAIAFCIFVGHELANIGWIALSQRAMDSLPDPPLKVDFANNEACGGAIWTSPRYRRNGFRLYNRYKRFEFLLEKGFMVNRSAIAKRNVVAQSGYRKFPPTRTYGEGRYLRVLWWKSWRERPLAA